MTNLDFLSRTLASLQVGPQDFGTCKTGTGGECDTVYQCPSGGYTCTAWSFACGSDFTCTKFTCTSKNGDFACPTIPDHGCLTVFDCNVGTQFTEYTC